MLPMFDLIQILNHLILDFKTFSNEKSMELCVYVIILHVLKKDHVHGYWLCKRLLVLIETVPFTCVNVMALKESDVRKYQPVSMYLGLASKTTF